MTARTRRLAAALAMAAIALPGAARAAEALVAVSANFAEVARTLKPQFEAATDHELTLTVGATGTLYAQVRKGAPYDVLLAADQKRPAKLEAAGEIVPGSRFTYAVGRLSLWSPEPERIGDAPLDALTADDVEHLAIANPKLAPYGRAAKRTLKHFGLWKRLSEKIVMGQNVGQTFSMVATGNAQLGLVATSYALNAEKHQPASRWDVPASAHAPIRQDAVRLRHGADNPAAGAFLSYLRSKDARTIIRRFGYRTGGNS
ncbi:molybdate transport system substrate-binding protein [Limimonas halophila]|uniref:Molybdate transport system substrate-binding protein n=1 Tax=Limimonas halophila TaxID=1082479 RepID=A0A1G7RVZ2_9PROT|nr:molybdate ABC transporter substrate-binding protein [Limimonas halophila]SDG14906.1 molybdate transport system substrate-binding protein [Limimonas halophila]